MAVRTFTTAHEIWEAGAVIEGMCHGYQRGRQIRIVLEDKNIEGEEVASMVSYLIDRVAYLNDPAVTLENRLSPNMMILVNKARTIPMW